MVGQRLAAAAQPATTQYQSPSQSQGQPIANTAVQGRTTGLGAKQATVKIGAAGGGVARGVGGFLRPFRRVGGILWLEVTGVFFLLPVIVFAPNLWRMRASWAHGPDHRTFIVTLLVVSVFLYLGVSSFWRARRR
jgi:hypothetical protein